MSRILFIIFFFLLIINLNAQDDKQIIVIGNTMIGKELNGESLREVVGNVIVTQGDVRITCDRAIQNLTRNEVELIGNVVVTQDSIVIRTVHGYYYGNTKMAFSNYGVDLFDGHVNLYAKNGYYYFDEKRSHFYNDVKLKEGVTTLSSAKLNYYDDEDKAVAVMDVQVADTSSTLFADSLIYFRNTKITDAFRNIRIYNSTNRVAVFGQRLFDDGQKKYTKVWENPFLVRIDTTSSGQLDTLMISSKIMETFDDSTQSMIATDSVKIVRQGFASKNNKTFYFQESDEIRTFRQENDELPPVIWNDNTQLCGDSIYVFIKDSNLHLIQLNSNSTIISVNEKYSSRFDQISGSHVKMFFEEDEIKRTEVDGNVLSIYFMYEDEEPNGLIKSSAQSIKMYFEKNEVIDVRMYGKPVTDYHPEKLITGKEKEFTIPSFRIYTDKPTKESLILANKNILNYLIKDSAYYVGELNSKK